ncbi:hypothetical protein GCM10011571_16610 [Marinithermofilum abyssi]|uniref:Uncharacterized protein n=1 Tax=Marinithermofilum abyssi TaxID=1571185 RepID=A0A8J2VBX1_9BACL|nr:hypothetical protein [Marinithermofilum abyssi]GGE15647.1 hypothetical protein GCM10011571_16610 [Marinithermofilum abyssi]
MKMLAIYVFLFVSAISVTILMDLVLGMDLSVVLAKLKHTTRVMEPVEKLILWGLVGMLIVDPVLAWIRSRQSNQSPQRPCDDGTGKPPTK